MTPPSSPPDAGASGMTICPVCRIDLAAVGTWHVPGCPRDHTEQPEPTGNGQPITELVIRDLQERSRVGALRYGTPLRAHNGRDPLRDAYEEALDLCQYLRQAIEEREWNVGRHAT
jgi:hypothetical protein